VTPCTPSATDIRQRLRRPLPVSTFTTSLTGKPIDVTTAGNHLADLIRAEHSTQAIQPGGGPVCTN
jgi:hypothetical protein